mmetsp:Transcript_62866/g.73517  ORF Transcript_62866/g.73517 Transcript_62866/m.73517 type:complete len:153 (-) Transcript_62866:399-857(-)
MKYDKILPNEVVGGVVDDNENVHMQEGDDYNTASSENNYSTSVPDSPSIRHICNLFLGLSLKATDLDVNYDSDDNDPPPAACDNIDAREDALLDGNELDKLAHEGTEGLSIFVYISVDKINKMKVDNLCFELTNRGLLSVSVLKKISSRKVG